MADLNQPTLGSVIFADIENNPYLNKLYSKILYRYGMHKMRLRTGRQLDPAIMLSDDERNDALRFADLLSKSNHPEKAESHKLWAQEIVILLTELYPKNDTVKLVTGSVFLNTGNHQGMTIIKSNFRGFDILEQIYSDFRDNYLTIPAQPELRFFNDQKIAYDHLTDPFFTYSGPTSMGKSFIMRMFIKEQVLNGAHLNFALLVPTKAMINEIKGKIIDDLTDQLKEKNYRVVTAAGELALEEYHNFIFVLTPERMLYLLIKKPGIHIDYLFVDEAHKLSGKNGRGPFYYKVVDMLLHREDRPHFIFAAPNIPNPEVYLRLLTDLIDAKDNTADSRLVSIYSPVTQIKFLTDLKNRSINIYNEHTGERTHLVGFRRDMQLHDLLYRFERYNEALPLEQRQQTIVYCNGRRDAVEEARKFADDIRHEKGYTELNALSNDIKKEVHGDYYLVNLLRKGVAYHVGYLPASIRRRIEQLFEQRKITTLFCTSTLLEGVNLPADNLFITNTKIFKSKMEAVDFRNLIGRVGRIRFNLYGNVFFVASGKKDQTVADFEEMLKTPVPTQSLSIATDPKVLKGIEKKYVAEILKSGTTEIPRRKNENGDYLQSEESYEMMRKFALVLLRDIMQNRDSLVRREFRDYITPEEEVEIRKAFTDPEDPFIFPDDDINTSVDQTKSVARAIQEGMAYPSRRSDGKFDYDSIVKFLKQLADVYDWRTYEASGLGKTDENDNLVLIRWYAVILRQWMEGYGLSFIMLTAIRWREQHPENFRTGPRPIDVTTYKPKSQEHKNIVFAQTLEVIDNVILFSISNYFLKFSNEYMRIHDITEFDNNWYEFVEYGTTNKVTITLQRHGFSREVATYIKDNHPEWIVEQKDGSIRLKRDALGRNKEHDNENTKVEANQVIFNSPDLFEPEIATT